IHYLADITRRSWPASVCKAAATLRRKSRLTRLLECGDLDLDAHPRIQQLRRNHHRRRSYVAEVLAKDRPALSKFIGVRQYVCDTNHVFETRPGLLQRRLDVLQALLGLRLN